MWSLSLPQVAATLAAALTAYQAKNAAGQRLIDKPILNCVLVLVVVTLVLGPILTERYGTRMVTAGLGATTGPATDSAAPTAEGCPTELGVAAYSANIGHCRFHAITAVNSPNWLLAPRLRS